MSKGKPKYYWDSTLFLALLKDEKRKAGEMEGLAEIVWMADHEQATVVTSVTTKGEVLQSTLPPDARHAFDQVFRRTSVVMVDLTERIADLVGEIRDFYRQQGKRLEVADAQHLATAIACQVHELHTFDEDDLIPLSGNIAGRKLIVCKPKGAQGILFP